MKTLRFILSLTAIIMIVYSAVCSADDFEQGMSYYQAQKYDPAIQSFTKVVDARTPRASEAKAMIGRSYQKKKDYIKAIECLDQLVSSGELPAGIAPDVKSDLGACYAMQRNCSKAMSIFQELLRDHPDKSYKWHYEMSNCYALQSKTKEAIDTLKAALPLAVAANDTRCVIDIKIRLSFRYLSQGNWDDAQQVYQQLITDAPAKIVDWRYRIGLCHRGKGEIEKAIPIFTELSKDTLNANAANDSKLRLAECMAAQGQSTEALASLEALYNENEGMRIDTLFVKADILRLYCNKPKESVDVFRQIIAASPASSLVHEALQKLGIALIDSGNIAEAREHFNDVAASHPSNDDWKYYIAYCDYRSGDFSTAKGGFQAAFNGNMEGKLRVQAKYLFADCLLQLGDRAGAKQVFENIVKDHTGNVWAKEACNRLVMMAGEQGGTTVE